MKTTNMIKRTLILTTIVTTVIILSSCKKEKIEDIVPVTTDVASLAVGNFIGSGEDASSTPFVNKVVKVTKVNDTRIKVEPVGHTSITAFEVNIMEMPTGPVSKDGESTDFAVRTDTSPNTIAFECANGQTFGGTKQ